MSTFTSIPLRGIRRRPDVTRHDQETVGEASAVLRDPLTNRLFELGEYELAIWELLDGRRSLDEIRRRFASRFTPANITADEILAFVHRLSLANLVITDEESVGTRYWQRAREHSQQATFQRWLRWWAIRLPAIDPSRWLERLEQGVRWIFSPAWVAASLALMATAVILLVLRWQDVVQRVGTSEAFLTPHSLLWFGVAIALTKACHELGHALVCHHFGGRCREMGLMLFFLTPCLYSNVSDAWLFRSRWQRFAVSTAGMWVELVLASGGFLLWWSIAPGVISVLLLRLCLVCSLHTILINGNPLLQYDGYFLLSDAFGISNLNERSRSAWSEMVQKWMTRDHVPSSSSRAMRSGLLGYAVAAWIYRTILVITAIVFLVRLGQSWELRSLGNTLALAFCASVVGPALYSTWRSIQSARHRQSLRTGRVSLFVLFGLSLFVLAGLIPVPRSLVVPTVVRPADAAWVYTTVPGRISQSAIAGISLYSGDPIVQLADAALQLEITELTAERDLASSRLKNLRARQTEDPAATMLLPTAQARLDDAQARLDQRRRDAQGLTCRSPVCGTLLPPPQTFGTSEEYDDTRHEVPPLDPRSQGAFLSRGTLVGIVGNPKRLEAIALVRQADLAALKVGQMVRVQIAASQPEPLIGSVAEIAQSPVESLPDDFIGVEELNVSTDSDGKVHPIATMHEVRMSLSQPDRQVPIGAHGRARILVEKQTLFARLQKVLLALFQSRQA